MHLKNSTEPNVILMIDDNPTDVLLIKEAFALCGENYEGAIVKSGV